MNILQATVYGIVQGATEYLPVSSSAHLAFVPWLTGWAPPSFAFDVLVQLGTLGAVVLYLRAEIVQIARSVMVGLRTGKPLHDEHAKLGWMVVVATLPAVVFGFALKDMAQAQWGDQRAVCVQLVVNGVMLIAAEAWAQRHPSTRALGWGAALLIGFGQALAILPAISRSGATIAVAMALGVPRKQAGAFSFLMSIPVMLGAGVLGAKDLVKDANAMADLVPLLAAAAVAAVVGFLVIRWFLDFVRSHALYGFGVYCVVVGAVGVGLTLWQQAGAAS